MFIQINDTPYNMIDIVYWSTKETEKDGTTYYSIFYRLSDGRVLQEDFKSEQEMQTKTNAIASSSLTSQEVINNVSYDAQTGVLTFTKEDGSTIKIDLPLELLIKSGSYDSATQQIILVLANGDKLTINVSDLIDIYYADEETIVLTEQGDKRIFSVKDGKFVEYTQDNNVELKNHAVLPFGSALYGSSPENGWTNLAAVKGYNLDTEDEVVQSEFGSDTLHTNINSKDRPTIETAEGQEQVRYLSDTEIDDKVSSTDKTYSSSKINSLTPVMLSVPVRLKQDKVYTQEEILAWFNVTSISDLKLLFTRNNPLFAKFGITLTTLPHYYKMNVEYAAFESPNQIKLVFLGLNTSNDEPSRFTIIANLDGTIIESNSNVQVTIEPLSVGSYNDLSDKPTINNVELKDNVTLDELNLMDKNAIQEALAGKAPTTDVSELRTSVETLQQNITSQSDDISTLNTQTTQLETNKLNKSLGTSAANKFLSTDSNGDVVPIDGLINEQQLAQALAAESASREKQDQLLQEEIEGKITPANIKAGDGINVSQEGNNVTINSTVQPKTYTAGTNMEITEDGVINSMVPYNRNINGTLFGTLQGSDQIPNASVGVGKDLVILGAGLQKGVGSVIVGNNAGSQSTLADNFISIGRTAMCNASQSIALGVSAQATQENQMMIGSSSFPINIINVTTSGGVKTVATTDQTVPAGGTQGQVLMKNSEADYDFSWASLSDYDEVSF